MGGKLLPTIIKLLVAVPLLRQKLCNCLGSLTQRLVYWPRFLLAASAAVHSAAATGTIRHVVEALKFSATVTQRTARTNFSRYCRRNTIAWAGMRKCDIQVNTLWLFGIRTGTQVVEHTTYSCRNDAQVRTPDISFEPFIFTSTNNVNEASFFAIR